MGWEPTRFCRESSSPDLPGYVTEEKCSAAQLSAEEKAKGSVLPWAIGAGVGALVLGLAIGRMSK